MASNYRYSRTTTTNRPGRRSLYAPPSRSQGSQHSLLGYWVPLVVTGTIAIGGLAAWVWSERGEHDEDDYLQDKPPRPPPAADPSYLSQTSQQYAPPPVTSQTDPTSAQGGVPPPAPLGGEAASYYQSSSDFRGQGTIHTGSRDVQQRGDQSWYGRMSGAIRRTPSPQQFFDSASKQVSAGMAAAGAALGSIMEDGDEQHGERRVRRKGSTRARREEGSEEREGFSDHERWSEEAEEKERFSTVEAESEKRVQSARGTQADGGRTLSKRAVAIVISADTNSNLEPEAEDNEFHVEHASVLSHVPADHTANLFVLIYAPTLTSLPTSASRPTGTSVVGSSYSQSSTPAVTPGSELQSISPRAEAADSPSKQFDALYQQALTIVSLPTQILPFTTHDGYVHLLRHLAPSLVYVSDTLAGRNGESITQLKGWVGHTILVAGDDGHGGLADTETETEDEGKNTRKEEKWYERSPSVGLGKDIEVVDAARVGDDWERRVGGRE